MHLTVTFNTAENCASVAASRFKSEADTDVSVITVPWDMLLLAKSDPNVVSIEQVTHEPEEFIIQGDISNADVAALITDVNELGEGFYHVTSTNGLALHDLVTSIDPVNIVSFGTHDVSTINSVSGTAITDPTSSEAQWARIRVVSTYRPLLTSFTYYDSLVTKSTPEVYLMDSGVNWDHVEFTELAHDDFWKSDTFADFSDKVGHGTAMASCIAGKNIGVAKNVKVRSIKISEDETVPFSLIDLNNAISALLRECQANPAVTRIVNASWTVPKNTFLESRFQALLNAGVTIVAAAGNTGTDIAALSPAGMANGVITVGAIDKYDIPAGFNNIAPSDSGLTTNYGNMLDMFAPGEKVTLALATDPTGYNIVSGTSASAAYVTGVAAQTAALFEGQVPNPVLMQKLIDVSTKDAILFDDPNFSEGQNKIVHLIGAEDAQANSLDLYMGYFHTDPKTITLDVNTIVDTSKYLTIHPEDTFTWRVTYENDTDGTNYGPFVLMDEVTGILTVNPPTIALQNDETIHMVMFTAHATNSKITLDTPWIFFYQIADSLSTEEAEQNITRALSATNSTSCFGSMFATLK